MTDYQSPIVHYGRVDYNIILSLGTDLLITEGDPLNGDHRNASVTDSELQILKWAGVDVVGYVNVAVTDDDRPYWNSSWTSDGTDTGTPTSLAPAWLKSSVPLDFDPVTPGPDARIVDFSDSDWQQLVLLQVLDLKLRGYSGVFLDDVGQYFPAGPAGADAVVRAGKMVDFIMALRAVVGPDFKIITNGVPFLGTDAGRNADFVDSIDAMVLEGYALQAAADRDLFLNHAMNYVAGGAQLLGVDYQGYKAFSSDIISLEELFDYHKLLDSHGISNFFSGATITSSQLYTYTNYGLDLETPTSGNDVLIDRGGSTRIAAGGGDDRVAGFGGNDILIGQGGNDSLIGGAGSDTLRGGSGNDELIGSRGADKLLGGRGQDDLTGGVGGDKFMFFSAKESTPAKAGRDTIMDFNADEGDLISLRKIDADETQTGNQIFDFIGDSAFSGAAGELRYLARNDFTTLLGDTDGDKRADFAITIMGPSAGFLDVSDFQL